MGTRTIDLNFEKLRNELSVTDPDLLEQANFVIQSLIGMDDELFPEYEKDREKSVSCSLLLIMEMSSTFSVTSNFLARYYGQNKTMPTDKGAVAAYLSILSEVVSKTTIMGELQQEIAQLNQDNSDLKELLAIATGDSKSH